ncbi:hypothetical protein [Candidatus Contendibacter odensensis]|uniref:Uncharacterized protein n=1 Tax=Candidatus Contendobacter odensis Run_B_J11 TaxID=1400861 RepID=A0A7U7J3M6_9GAMM|nr:hypothetical protein [Candidatus Contendobacter odensis]MBK8752282.1 hypothetical protein [Candidatus Competibacteraceae bacterium]CDH44744.1 hypothetical protein BN874_1860008 [Candidatus Contendobacter odensis Run_B_J11]
MSEDRAVYISCASGEQMQTDFLIQRRGDLVQILGHPDLLMTPKDALSAASALKRFAMAALVDSMQQSETLDILAVAFERMNDAHD